MLQQSIRDVAAINDFVAAHAQFLVNGKKRRVFGRITYLQLAIPHQLSHGCLGCGTEWKVTENCLWEKPLLLDKYFKLAFAALGLTSSKAHSSMAASRRRHCPLRLRSGVSAVEVVKTLGRTFYT